MIPDFITSCTARVWRMSLSGLPRITNRSASFPGSTVPRRASTPSARAPLIVAIRSAAAGGIPARTSAELELINARRSANGLQPYNGPTDDASVLTEFMTQKTLDFFLEGKRLGDFRRNGSAVLNVPTPGASYFKTGFDPIGDQTCYPLPLAETSNNPHFGD